MDTELDKWICEKLAIPYKPLTWDDVIYYEMITRWGSGLKVWPKRSKHRRYGVVIHQTYKHTSGRITSTSRICKWYDGSLARSSSSKRKWFHTEPLPYWYAQIVKNINQHKLTLKQFRDLYARKDNGTLK